MTAIILLPLLLAATPSQAVQTMDHAPVACASTPAPPPAELAGWSAGRPVRAGATAAGAALLPIGHGVVATLLPTPKVRYAVRPEKPGGSVSNGGLFAFSVPTAGRYRIALGSGAWIDVLSGTTPATSVAHEHGPDCTGIRKMVDFDLQPGRYLLQVAGNGSPTLPLMVARVP
ncbi:homogentisate 1,2-dioxygenase [Sphingomonas sp. ac-8]|uniref:homogentisate 1,2-dioxygenase n=1 Tax=Sphingomonas sp. ac-8 TaxID=3242977 RepID=UPI003A7FC02A